MQQGASGRGTFSFISLGTRTGTFKSLKTSAVQGASGGYKIIAQGPVLGEFAAPLVPNDDITVTIGGDGGASSGVRFTIPLTALKIKGAGKTTFYSYSKKLQPVAELLKFQLSNAKRKFVLATTELPDTGIPAAGEAGTAHDLPLVMLIPTTAGPFRMETTVELKRSSSASKNWKR